MLTAGKIVARLGALVHLEVEAQDHMLVTKPLTLSTANNMSHHLLIMLAFRKWNKDK